MGIALLMSNPGAALPHFGRDGKDGDTCFFANLIIFLPFSVGVFALTLLPVSLKLQLPYLGFYIFQKQVTQWAKSGDTRAKNRRIWPKNLSTRQKKQVSASLPSLPKWGNAAPDILFTPACPELLVCV